MKKAILLLTMMLLLVGCGKEAVQTSNEPDAGLTSEDTLGKDGKDSKGDAVEGYSFLYNEVKILMNVDATPIIEALGESVSYFEAPSCAFQGLDKIYTYNGFEVSTYPNNEQDYISSVYFLDDSVATEKGIYIGASLDEVIAAYGEGYTENSSEYTYTLGESKLSFIIEEDAVTAITYSAIVEGLE